MKISACKLPVFVVAVCLLVQGPAAFAQIKSFSVGQDQALTYPSSSGPNPLAGLADDHTTFFPPAASGAPYLVFGGASPGVSSDRWGAVVLQTTEPMTTELTTFDFAPGYNFPVLTSPNLFSKCNLPTENSDNTGFDENYAAPGSVLQDPTLPAGNLMMIYHAENHCPGGVFQRPFYATVGFTRSSDNGKTWPAPEGGELGGPSRYAVIRSPDPPPTGQHNALGDAAPSAIVYKSADGNYYLYVAYAYYSSSGQSVRAARAKLVPRAPGEQADPPLTFLKWYNGSFSEPGIIPGMDKGGQDSPVMPSTGCGSTNETTPDISYNDDLGLYLMITLCYSPNENPGAPAGYRVGGWYYSTATSLDLEDWTTPQFIQNSQHPKLSCTGDPYGYDFDGDHPSTLSPGAATGHTKLTGLIFLTHIECELASRQFLSRTFTIVAEPK